MQTDANACTCVLERTGFSVPAVGPGTGGGRTARRRGPNQCDISTGTVMAPNTERLAPPSSRSRVRLRP